MVVEHLFGASRNRQITDFLSAFMKEQCRVLEEYIKNYPRKLQLIDAFSHEWDADETQRLRQEIGGIMRLVITETSIVSRQEESIRRIILEMARVIERELDSGKRILESDIQNHLIALLRKLKIWEKNLALQERWFRTHTTATAQNENKDSLISLVKKEGIILFDIDATDIKEGIMRISQLLNDEGTVEESTYEACERELHRELEEFDRDRLDIAIVRTSRLGESKNLVVLVRTSDACELVAKAYTEIGAFPVSMNARKLIIAAGGLVPKIIRISDNEIIGEKVSGISMREIFTKQSEQAIKAFYTLGRAIATIHKNTLNKLSSYDPRAVFRRRHTSDFIKLKDHMKLLEDWGLVSKETYMAFINAGERYFPKYLSIIHGDAHLGNFFYLHDLETVIIVDYDDAKPGDPLADVGRVIASIRYWQYKAKLNVHYANETVMSFIHGYQSILAIELRGTDLYTLRLYAVVIKSYRPLIEKVKTLLHTGASVPDTRKVMRAFFRNQFTDVSRFHPRELEKLNEIRFCLEQIDNFIYGKDVDSRLAERKLAA